MARRKKSRPAYTIRAHGRVGGEVACAFDGRLSLEDMDRVLADLRGLRNQWRPASMVLNLEGLSYLDSGGALALRQFEAESRAGSVSVRFAAVRDAFRGVMNLLDMEALSLASIVEEKQGAPFFAWLTNASMRAGRDFVAVMTFVGELLTALVQALVRPQTLRWGAVAAYMKRVGVDGFPIVTLISALLGMIIAFMSSLQLRQFGADTYVASLVGFAMVRELGPIMTAILVAGRTGSAFSAEIGSMRINEEVDALMTMGFDPIRFLVVPKVVAAVVMVPLLTLYADLFGILGGLFVGLAGMDLTVTSYLQQTLRSFGVFDLVSSYLKSMVFAACIAGISCQRGFEVRGGAEAVGAAATSAVVSSIFLVILVDSVFAILLYYIR